MKKNFILALLLIVAVGSGESQKLSLQVFNPKLVAMLPPRQQQP